MDTKINQFTQTLRLIESHSSRLSASTVYCIGQCAARRGDYTVQFIVDVVGKLGGFAAEGVISEAQRTIAEFYLSEGNVENAVKLIEKYEGVYKKRSREEENREEEVVKRPKVKVESPEIKEEITVNPRKSTLLCAICTEIIPEEDYLPLEKCGCMFHRECVFAYLQTAITQQKHPITCPQARCRAEIMPIDLKERLPQSLYQQFEKYQFDKFVQRNVREYQRCPTPECPFVFAWTKENPRFKCPMCKKVWCLLCKNEYHEGISCKEYEQLIDRKQLDEQFDRKVTVEGYQQCPVCHAWIEKVDGCNSVTCVCGENLCYGCGCREEECQCNGDEQGTPVCPGCQETECVCQMPICMICFLPLDKCRC